MCVLGFYTYTAGPQPTLYTWKSMYRGAERQLIFPEMALYPFRASDCQEIPGKEEALANLNPSKSVFCKVVTARFSCGGVLLKEILQLCWLTAGSVTIKCLTIIVVERLF